VMGNEGFQFHLTKEDKRNVLILLIVAITLRLYAFSQIYLISTDGAFQYIPTAMLFYEGKYLQALTQPQLPLYPFLISLLNRIIGNPELAGQIISIFFSILALIPLYFLGKYLFSSKPAFWATLLYVIHPDMLRYSVDVLKEGLVIFCFLSSMYFSIRFLRERRGVWLIWTVTFTVMGALSRITALSILLALGVWLGYCVLRGGLKDKRVIFLYLGVLLLSFGIIVIFVIPGIWGWEVMMTKKHYGVAREIVTGLFGYQWPSVSYIAKKLGYGVVNFLNDAYPLPISLAFIGIGWRVKKKEFVTEEGYLILFMVIILSSFFIRDSVRYLLPAIFMSYLWAGLGFVKVRDFIDRRYKRHPNLNTFVIVTVLVLSIVPLSLKPQRLDKIGRKEVGLWLRERSLSKPLIVTNVPRVAYYAGGSHIRIYNLAMPIESIIKIGKDNNANYLVLEKKRGAADISYYLAPFEQQGLVTLLLRYPYGKEGRVIYVYWFHE